MRERVCKSEGYGFDGPVWPEKIGFGVTHPAGIVEGKATNLGADADGRTGVAEDRCYHGLGEVPESGSV